MDAGSSGPVQHQQQLRKRTPDKSGMNNTSAREQSTSYCLIKDLNDQDEDLDLLTKKQRQGSPDRTSTSVHMDNGGSTGSSETGDTDSSCAHVGKAVNLNVVRKIIMNTNGGKLFTDCVDCKRNPQTLSPSLSTTNNGDPMNSAMSELYEFDDSMWICLRCGHAGCSRLRAAHAVAHNAAPHSDSHDLVVQTGTWRVWCYKCDDDVNITKRTAKLRDAVEYLKKLAGQSNPRHKSTVIALPPCQPMEIPPSSPTQDYTIFSQFTTSTVDVVRARGLRNLGNTCFFNSVMQCLGQTPYLVELLRETETRGLKFQLRGGQVPLSTVEQEEEDKERMKTGAGGKGAKKPSRIVVEPLQGELKEWGPLAKVLALTLDELQSGRAEVYNPRPLLGQLSLKHPQFSRGDQQDAHELLRHLLEAVREEDLRRYHEVILNKHDLSGKTDPASIDADKRKILKFYGSQAEVLLPTLQVFKGILVSTLQCKDCGHTSNREEFFLDLSLPINEQQPKHRRKPDELEEHRPSKHQLKKEKRAAAKKNKKSKNYRTNQTTDMSITQNVNEGHKSDTDSDADVEDNLDDTNTASTSQRNNNNNNNKSSESGYNSDSRTRQSPDSGQNSVASPMTVGVTGDCGGGVDHQMVSPGSSGSGSGGNIGGAQRFSGQGTPNCDDGNDPMERPPSRLEHVPHRNDLRDNLSKLTLDYSQNQQHERMELDSPQDLDLDSSHSLTSQPIAYSHPSSSNNSPSADAPVAVNDLSSNSSTSSDHDDNDDDDGGGGGGGGGGGSDDCSYTHTPLGGRYSAADGECSVQSCLAQFTSSELMLGANAVLCTLCTRRASGKKQYRTALKQLLIYQPPPVLILHLKRFQVHHYHSAKLSKKVSFPFLLDLAPFCSRRSRNNKHSANATTSNTGNTVQYALYGVVEHSGSIHGGHYVAYVKVRPTLEKTNPRWRHLSNSSADVETKIADVASGIAGGAISPPSGRWYYISDSHVNEVSEDRVLDSQAYLLFYERLV